MKKNFIFQLKSYLLLFVLSLCCGSAWATDETPVWTITPGEITLDGTTAKINVTATAKLGTDDWVTALGTTTTVNVKFYSPSFDEICTGTLSAGTGAGNYVITVSGTYDTGSEMKPVVDKLKAYQGQKIKIQFPAGALKASSPAISSNSYTLTTTAVDYTIPAAVAITPSYTALYIDHLQAENGFYFYVTAGTTQPHLSSDAKIYLGESTESRFVVSLVGDPTQVGTNTWKYTAKVEKQGDYILHYTDNQGITASSFETVPTGTTLPLTFTAGAFSSGLSQNSEAAINITVREAQGANWSSEKPLSIDEAQSTVTFVPTGNSQALTILDATKIKLVYYTGPYENRTANIVTTATFSVAPATSVEGSSSLILSADFSRGKDPYHVIFESGAIRAGSSDYSIPTEGNNIIATIEVKAPVFVDPSVTGATATTKADVRAGKTYNEFTYKRNYTGKTETLYVPFDIKPTAENQILDNVYIWKLVNITEENGQPVFNFTQVENGATVHANMPYLIRKKDGVAGVYEMVLNNVTTNAPVSTSIESSTVTDTYTFTGVVEQTNLVGSTGKVWYVKKSTGNLNNLTDGQNGTLAAWRWYMTTTSTNTQYAKIRLDGVEDDEPTSIGQIENGTLYMVNGKCFNLNGQRMSKPQRGSINIINGKKVFVK